MISGIFCIETAFPLCVWIDAFSSVDLSWNVFHMFYKTPQYVVADVFQVQFQWHKIFHNDHIERPCVLLYALKGLPFDQMIFHIFCIWNSFHPYEQSDGSLIFVHLQNIYRMSCRRLASVLYEIPYDTSIVLLPQKIFPQCWQENGLSPEWYFLCLPRVADCVKDLLQCLHGNGLSPVWTTLCIFRLWPVLKYFPQKRHRNSDFGSVWTLMWDFNWPGSGKVLPQFWQENGLSPEWFLSCLPSVPACVKDLLHCLHGNDLSPVCTASCLFKSCLVLKSCPQTMHSTRIFDFTGFSFISISTFSIAAIVLEDAFTSAMQTHRNEI